MKKLFALFILLLSVLQSFGQGCSDAGFCTLSGLAPLDSTAVNFNAELRLSFEATEPGALLFSPQLRFRYKISSKTQIDVRLPFWMINADSLGAVNKFSDPIIAANFEVLERNDFKMTLILGMRIGVNNANATGPFGDLPMDYQSSLGTTDLIIGLNVAHKDFSASLAIQNPTWQYNSNQNVIEKYVAFDGLDTISMEYIRKADLMLRIEKKWTFNNLKLRLGILPIFHLGNDYINGISVSAITPIENSAGITLNIPMGAWYTYKNWIFGLDIGFPVVTRKERPDGLTRKYVVQPRIVYNFTK